LIAALIAAYLLYSYRWFPKLLTPWTVASICSNFEDYTTICKLLMLGMYNEHWFDPKSILSECTTGVYLGFVPTSKGDFTTSVGVRHDSNAYVHVETRNYICGQMAMGDRFTSEFLEELRRRTNRLHLVVYEGTSADATVHPTEPDLFISRYRSAASREGLHDAEWTTTMTLEDIKNQLRMRKTSMYDPIVVDSWQFIIIDREVGQPFELMDLVQDALLMLVGDPMPRSIAKRVIRSVIPPSIQEIFLEEMVIDSSPDLRYPPPHDVQYDGNRFRCFDPDQNVIVNRQREAASEKLTRNENRFVRRVIEDMERCGIISLVQQWEEPQSQPVIMQGADGALDLYFPYEHTETKADGQRITSLPFPPTNTLYDFAQAFKELHPQGIMAKGSIQTHYCAWPMPAIRSLGSAGTNFATPEGQIYHWNAMRTSLPFLFSPLKTYSPPILTLPKQPSTARGPHTHGNTTSSTTSTRNTPSSCSTSLLLSSAPSTPTMRKASPRRCLRRRRTVDGEFRFRKWQIGSSMFRI
jgi:hypothetical protein